MSVRHYLTVLMIIVLDMFKESRKSNPGRLWLSKIIFHIILLRQLISSILLKIEKRHAKASFRSLSKPPKPLRLIISENFESHYPFS